MLHGVMRNGLLFFLVFLFCHVLLWRLKRPRRQIPALFIIFYILPLFCLLLYCGITHFFEPLRALAFHYTFSEWLLLAIFHCVLSSAYILTYPAAQAVSPSLKLALLIKQSMPQGATAEELAAYFTADELLDKRIEDVFDEEFVRERAGVLELTGKGRFIVSIFIFIRRMLGLPIGKG
jgi:hypothetical protein